MLLTVVEDLLLQHVEAGTTQGGHGHAVGLIGCRPNMHLYFIAIADLVDFVHHQHGAFALDTQICQHRLHRLHLCIVMRVTHVHDMQKQIGFQRFLEGCTK